MNFFRNVKDCICSYFRYIEHLFHKKDISDLVPALKRVNSEKIFAGIQPGDIIIATTCQTYDELKKVPEGHRLRPMIVAKKEEEYVYAFSGSSKNKHYRIMFVMDGKKYNIAKDGVYKDGYVNLSRVKKIPKSNIQYNKCSLTLLDQLKINDTIWNRSHSCKMQYIALKNVNLQPGQVVRKENELYYLAEVNDNTGIVYKMHRNNDCFNEIQIPFGKQVYTLSDSGHEEKLNDLIPTSVIEKKYKKQIGNERKTQKQSSQKKWELNTNHYFRYDAGKIFLLGSMKCVYLFSNSGEDYGVRKYDEEEIYDYLNLEKLDRLDEYFYPSGKLNDDELYETVLELISYHKKYEWLLNDLFVVE